jgi:hypothetical protein
MGLWKLRRPMIHSLATGDPGKLSVYFTPKSEGLIPGEADGETPSLSLNV